jgi:hypothetical protein
MSGVPVKARNIALGKRSTHVQRQSVVLATMGLVGENDYIGAVAEHLR